MVQLPQITVQTGQIGRQGSRTQKQAWIEQIRYQAEVDEGALNPLISSAFTSLARCQAPNRRRQVSCYALGYPLSGTRNFGASFAAVQ